MPSINLAPGTQYIIAARKRRVRLYVIAISIVIVFALAWAGLYSYQLSLAAESERIQKDINEATAQIQVLRQDAIRVSLFEKRLDEVQQLLATHVNWTPVFADLERLLPPDTVLTSFEAASDGSTITIQGKTAQVDQVSLAVASLTAGESHPSVFSGGSVKNIQRQQQTISDQVSTSYSFTVTLTFDPKILWQ